MKFQKVYSLEEIANLLNCEFVGDKNFQVLGMNEIHVVEPGDIVFVSLLKSLKGSSEIKRALPSGQSTFLLIKTIVAADCNALS